LADKGVDKEPRYEEETDAERGRRRGAGMGGRNAGK